MPRDCATPQAQFVLGKKVSMMWFRYGHFENRPGDLFDPNHLMVMKECSHVDSPSTSRKISFAGSSAVAVGYEPDPEISVTGTIRGE